MSADQQRFDLLQLVTNEHYFRPFNVNVEEGLTTEAFGTTVPMAYRAVHRLYETIIPRLESKQHMKADDPLSHVNLLIAFGLSCPRYLLPKIDEIMRGQTIQQELGEEPIILMHKTTPLRLPGSLPEDQIIFGNSLSIVGTDDMSLPDWVNHWKDGSYYLPPSVCQTVTHFGITGMRTLTAQWSKPRVEYVDADRSDLRGWAPRYEYNRANIAAVLRPNNLQLSDVPLVSAQCRFIPVMQRDDEQVHFREPGNGVLSYIQVTREAGEGRKSITTGGYFSHNGKEIEVAPKA